MREVSNSDKTGVQEGRPTCAFRLKRVTRREQKVIPRFKKQMKVEEGQVVMAYLCNQHLPRGMRSNRRQAQIIQSRDREGPKERFARLVPWENKDQSPWRIPGYNLSTFGGFGVRHCCP